MHLIYFLQEYLKKRPLFLSLIRAKEASLYQKYLPLKRPVLDVGCGDGFFANILLTPLRVQPLKVVIDTGVDLKESRIEDARKLGIYKYLVTYDGKHLPFPDEHFSTVISNCVLEHVPNLDLTIKEIYRVLKPGGLFLTTVAAKNWEEYLLGNLILGDIYKMWMRKKQVHYHLLHFWEWEKVFTKAGFKIIKETGYLDKRAVRWIDFFHYLSLPSLLTYKLTGHWVIWQNKLFLFPIDWLGNLISGDLPADRSGNIFFALVKR